MAKKKNTKTRKQNWQRWNAGIVVFFMFLVPMALGIATLTFIFNLVTGQNMFSYIFAGFAIPVALALIYRWRVGKWPTLEDK